MCAKPRPSLRGSWSRWTRCSAHPAARGPGCHRILSARPSTGPTRRCGTTAGARRPGTTTSPLPRLRACSTRSSRGSISRCSVQEGPAPVQGLAHPLPPAGLREQVRLQGVSHHRPPLRPGLPGPDQGLVGQVRVQVGGGRELDRHAPQGRGNLQDLFVRGLLALLGAAWAGAAYLAGNGSSGVMAAFAAVYMPPMLYRFTQSSHPRSGLMVFVLCRRLARARWRRRGHVARPPGGAQGRPLRGRHDGPHSRQLGSLAVRSEARAAARAVPRCCSS